MKFKHFVLNLFLITLFSFPLFAQPRSAIITLTIPPGARQLGMGETGVALVEDAWATYWNPAGQAFAPLSDEWAISKKSEGNVFTGLTTRKQPGFLGKAEAWTSKGSELFHYNNKHWDAFWQTSLEGNLKIPGIVRRFVGSDEGLDEKVKKVLDFNGIKTKEDQEFAVEIRLPWSLVLKDSITTLLYEQRTEKLWVGTNQGLWRFDGSGWKAFRELKGKTIHALADQGATVWIGTNDGLFKYSKGEMEQKGKILPTQNVLSIAWSEKHKELYLGLENGGLARLTPADRENTKDRWAIYSTDDGLLDNSPLKIAIDDDHVWATHKGGVSHFNRKKWAQIQFSGSEVRDISISEKSVIWIATNNGLIAIEPNYALASGPKSELEENTKTSQKGLESIGEWVHYHTGTGLHSNEVKNISIAGSEIWINTSAGIEKMNKAPIQLGAFYETLLPSLNINDLYHFNAALTVPVFEWGTLGWYINFVSFGESSLDLNDNTNGEQEVKVNSLELVTGLTYGIRMTQHQGLGLAFKLIYSDLISGIPNQADAKTTSYAVDLAYLAKDVGIDGLHFGVVIANMGPDVYYVDKSKTEPIPLMWKLGVSYDILSLPTHRVVWALDYKKEAVTIDSEGETDPFYVALFKTWEEPGFDQVMINTGVEYTYNSTLSLRAGYLNDQPGQREELDLGIGVLLSDIMQFDFAMIKDLSGNEVRDGQTRFGMLFLF